MDEHVVTAAPPPARVRNLSQQETDFTSEGSPPPGVVGPIASLPSVDMASDHVNRKPMLPVTVRESVVRDAAQAAKERSQDAHPAAAQQHAHGKPATRHR